MSPNPPLDGPLTGTPTSLPNSFPPMDPPPTADTSSLPRNPPNRRSKAQLSCNLCRRRKLRCDRQQPCTTCSGRGLALSCTYSKHGPGPPGAMQQQQQQQRRQQTQAARTRVNVQDRLVQLENIVVSLMQNSPLKGQPMPDENLVPGPSHLKPNIEGHDEASIDAEDSPPQSDCGSMIVSSSEFQYVGGNHWAAILDGIADLKEHFEREEDDVEVFRTPHTLLLYGCKPASKAEILTALPPRPIVDRFVSQYFNRLDIASWSLHNGQFLREYEQFWNTPFETSTMWLGLLFSMICLVVVASDTVETATEEDHHLVDTYKEKIVQCLILGEYTKSGRYTFEILIHYLTIEFSTRKDADKDIYILLGMIVNLSLRRGYHRDPSHFPGISPFTGEMRRRAWVTVLQGDVLISTQMGMPRMIKDWQCDTVEPQNLNDSDFDEETKELPPPRPETEITTVSNLIARRRIFTALGMIIDLTAAVRPYSYTEVKRVDRILQEAEATIPAYLRMKTMATSVTDPPQVIMQRLFIMLMIHKGQIMLHRKYLTLSPSEGQDPFTYSRKSCLDAALGLLKIQQIFNEETGPDGQLYTVRWRISSFASHEFLTATMILCFLLQQDPETFIANDKLDQEEIKTALKKSQSIWIRLSHSSTEARTAAKALDIVLTKVSPTDTIWPHSSFTRPDATSSMELEGTDFYEGTSLKPDEQFNASLAPFEAEQAEQDFLLGMPYARSDLLLDDSISNDLAFPWQWLSDVSPEI